MKRLKLLITLVLTLFVLTVVIQNVDSVETRVLFWTLAMPRALLLFLSVLTGFVLGLLTVLGLSASKTPSRSAP